MRRVNHCLIRLTSTRIQSRGRLEYLLWLQDILSATRPAAAPGQVATEDVVRGIDMYGIIGYDVRDARLLLTARWVLQRYWSIGHLRLACMSNLPGRSDGGNW